MLDMFINKIKREMKEQNWKLKKTYALVDGFEFLFKKSGIIRRITLRKTNEIGLHPINDKDEILSAIKNMPIGNDDCVGFFLLIEDEQKE